MAKILGVCLGLSLVVSMGGLAISSCSPSEDPSSLELTFGKADMWGEFPITIPAHGSFVFKIYLADASFQVVLGQPDRQAPLDLLVNSEILAHTETSDLNHRIDISERTDLRLEVRNLGGQTVRATLSLGPPIASVTSKACQSCDLATSDCVRFYKGQNYVCIPKEKTCNYADGTQPGYLLRQCGCTGAEWCLSNNKWSGTCVTSGQYFSGCTETTFCEDPQVEILLGKLRSALRDRDGAAMKDLASADGLKIRWSWHDPEVTIPQGQLAQLFTSAVSYDWGFADGSGEPIAGPFAQVILPVIERDMIQANPQRGCNEILAGSSAGLIQLPDGVDPQRYYSLHRPAPDEDNAFDWGTWVVGMSKNGTSYVVSHLVHYQWEI